jgi:predicted permease
VNVASLLVARAAARRKELAVRVALGGGRSRIIRERLVEGLLLSTGGGVLGIVLAWAALQWLIHVRQDMNRLDSIHIDGWVVAFTLGAITLCVLVAGLTSALSIDGKRLLDPLHESSRGNSSHAGVGLRRALVSLEVGLTVVLLIGAGLLMKSYQRMRTANLGIPTNNVLTMQFSLLGSRYLGPPRSQFADFYERILERVRALPGVQSAGLVNFAPGQGWGGNRIVAVPERGAVLPGKGVDVLARGADPGYFSAVGIPLLRGRTFTPDERGDRANTTLVSADAAKLLFPEEDPIGKHLKDSVSGETWQIVGIVGNTRFSVREPGRPTMYIPIFGTYYSSATLVMHGSNDVEAHALPVQKIIAGIKSDLPVFDIQTMDETLGRLTLNESFDATLLVGFAALSLVLAAVGLFGVLSYMVAQRAGEIGIRIAVSMYCAKSSSTASDQRWLV